MTGEISRGSPRETDGTDMRIIVGKALAEPHFRKALRATPKEALESAGFELSEVETALLHKTLTTNGVVYITIENPITDQTMKHKICNNCDCSIKIPMSKIPMSKIPKRE